jgi:hypothetical protein
MKQTILKLLLLISTAEIPLLAQNRACQLLTADEVKSATGISYGAPQGETTPQGDITCMYSSGPSKRFAVAIHEKGGKALYQRNKAVASKRMTVTPVSGIADDAYLAAVGPVNQFSFVKGDTVVAMTIFGPPGAAPLQDLARKVVGRL